MREWTRKRKLLWIFSTGVSLLLVAIIIPNFVTPRFDYSSVPLGVRLLVTDREQGKPIQGATVRVPSFHEESVTGIDGRCEAIAHFRMTGTSGRSAEMHFHGTMTISAPGYQPWENSFVSLFGPSYDYFHKGTSVTCEVKMVR